MQLNINSERDDKRKKEDEIEKEKKIKYPTN